MVAIVVPRLEEDAASRFEGEPSVERVDGVVVVRGFLFAAERSHYPAAHSSVVVIFHSKTSQTLRRSIP